jgi:hypothetical protein
MSTIYVTDGAAHAAIRLGTALSEWGRNRVIESEQRVDRTDTRRIRRAAESAYEQRRLDAQRLRTFR